MASEGETNPRREIARLITISARQMRQHFDRHVRDMGVTRSQWAMIVVVSRAPGATQRRIAEVLEMSEASAGRLIDRLCADGLLERSEQENDRRARAVRITDKAAPLLERLGDYARESEAEVFKGFSDGELAVFGDLLKRLNDNLSR